MIYARISAYPIVATKHCTNVDIFYASVYLMASTTVVVDSRDM